MDVGNAGDTLLAELGVEEMVLLTNTHPTQVGLGGYGLSIVGGGDYAPHTTATRLLYLVNSLIGASVLSLVLSYLVQVYSALRERNTLALTVHLMTGGTGHAAEMLARLGTLGAEPVMSSPSDFTAYLKNESDRLGKVIRERGISAD